MPNKSTIAWYRIKRSCSFNYRKRGTQHRDETFALKHKTDFGLFLIKLRTENGRT